MIRAEHVSKSFLNVGQEDVRALEDVSLEIHAGRFAVVTGPSGSGKSTLLSVLGALSRPSRGAVLLRGRNLAECSDVELARMRRQSGFVFQNASLLSRIPAWENVTYPLIPRGVSRGERYGLAKILLARLGLEGKVDRPPEQLSGGEQQRVAVARALAVRPSLIVADEPTSNLDPASAHAVTRAFEEAHASGVTLVVATHDARLLSLATDRFELREGKLACP